MICIPFSAEITRVNLHAIAMVHTLYQQAVFSLILAASKIGAVVSLTCSLFFELCTYDRRSMTDEFYISVFIFFQIYRK